MQDEPPNSRAERFAALFDGLDRAFGQTRVPQNAKADLSTGKVEARCLVVPEPPTVELWRSHLGSGSFGLGIFAMRADATCLFGAIDVDVYRNEAGLERVLAHVRATGLPLIGCRTKSGGLHLYLFLSEPVPARLVRRRLSEWAKALGQPKDVEIFPKQVDFSSVDFGNYINMPYIGGEYSLLYAYGPAGTTALSIDEFLDLAEKSRITAEQLASWEPVPALAPRADGKDVDATEIEEDFGDFEGAGFAGVTEDHLWFERRGDDYWAKLSEGLTAGGRHDGLKALAGLLFGRIEPHLAEVLVRLFAEHQCDPPMTRNAHERREVSDIIRWTLDREMAQ